MLLHHFRLFHNPLGDQEVLTKGLQVSAAKRVLAQKRLPGFETGNHPWVIGVDNRRIQPLPQGQDQKHLVQQFALGKAERDVGKAANQMNPRERLLDLSMASRVMTPKQGSVETG